MAKYLVVDIGHVYIDMENMCVRRKDLNQYMVTAWKGGQTVPSTVVVMPSLRMMQRLAEKYLDSDYYETDNCREVYEHCLSFFIRKGTTKEERAAFLGAVASHIRFKM